MSKPSSDCLLCGAIEPYTVGFEFPNDPKLRSRWLQFCGLKPEQDLWNQMKLCCYHFKKEDLVIHDKVLELKSNSVPVNVKKESSIFGRSRRTRRNFEQDNLTMWSHVSRNEGNSVVSNDCSATDSENSYVPENDTSSIYEAVHQDILSTFENKIITISDPEEVRSVGNVQVISFVSEEELLSDDEPAPKLGRRKRVRVVGKPPTSLLIDAANDAELLSATDEPKAASYEFSDPLSYLGSVDVIRKNRDFDHPFGNNGGKRTLYLESHPRYAGDIKANTFTSIDAGRKAVSVLKKIALAQKTKLKRAQRRNLQLNQKVLALQDKLIQLTEETIW